MKPGIVFLLTLFLAHTVSAQQQDVKVLTKAFDKFLTGHFKNTEPGATVLVARHGQVIYKKAFGMANMELQVPMQVGNIFRIGSITKQFTAVAILQLVEQGKLNLQDEITKFVPGYPTQNNRITIEHLLTHTSGIRDYASMRDTVQRGRTDVTPTEMINYFKDQPMRFATGTKWEYSNSNYFLLGYIIEKITGKTYAQYLEEKFFKPAGMSNSFYSSETKIIANRANGYSKNGNVFENTAYLSMTHPYAAGAILSTVEDLFKWQQALISYKLVRKEILDKAWMRYQLNDGSKINYGYGWRQGYIQESPSLWHGGLVNGFKTMSIYLPKENVYVAVLTNCDAYFPEDIIANVAAIAIGQPYEHQEIKLPGTSLKGYTGVYENGKGLVRVVSAEGDRLYVQLNRAPKARIKAYKKDQFFIEGVPMQSLEFRRNSKGEIETLISKSRTAIEAWSKTSKPIPSADGIKVDEKILEKYTGEYEFRPGAIFTVTRQGQQLFLQLGGQDKLEIFAETETKFFLKVNDAVLEFVKDDLGVVTGAIVNQGGRETQAKKIK